MLVSREAGSPWRLPEGSPWWDAGLKLLTPALLALLLGAAYQCGSLSAYFELLSRQRYASLVPALGALYALAILGFQGLAHPAVGLHGDDVVAGRASLAAELEGWLGRMGVVRRVAVKRIEQMVAAEAL